MRCAWAKAEPNISYHDNEWGHPQHDDQKLFEFLVLEGAQAGLSWTTILNRREGYRKAFSGFNVRKVAKYTQRHIDDLLRNESIIRNRLKIHSAINNAQHFMMVQKEFGSFDKYLWGFVDYEPVRNGFKRHSDLPAFTETSKKLSLDLKKRGFSFVGPTICYALMQAVGMVNDHTSECFLFQAPL